ncbi:subtype A tannase [uncultured Jatrophihabitans sp.]|uniref:subtype A tannase n=1 Tax=uncultured Jatrophihabitans sp. TaxID=1610747 RepID=UPI0035CBCD9F
MDLVRRKFLQGSMAAGVVATLGLAGCTSKSSSSSKGSAAAASSSSAGDSSLALDHTAWSWDETNDVYYQIGKYYVSKPQAKEYETLGVYVPGRYFTATKNSDGTFTAKINPKGKTGKYTARTAPMVIPVNTPGYAAQKPPSSYSYNDVSSYIKAGFVYVAPGLRGRDSETSSYTGNAPWGVTDLKATVRYLRYNAGVIPGDEQCVVVFGTSGGGAQGTIAGASGDSALYKPYLHAIGAAMRTAGGRTISDSIAGVMAWVPITNLDYSNTAYEWNMGQFASTGTRASGTWTSAYSGDLATAFASYQNALRLRDTSGKTLELTKSASGNHLAGSYYDHVIEVITTSLNDFLSDTTFPYSPSTMGGMGGAPGGGGAPTGTRPTGGAGGSGGGTAPTGGTAGGGAAPGGSTSGSSSTTSKTYKTVAEYIAYLNTDSTWVEYDASTKTAKVLSLAGFVKSQKNASKDVGAFDGIARGETENLVFGLGTSPLHFQNISQQLIAARHSVYAKLSGWKAAYAASEYTSDFKKTDTIGSDIAVRSNMYNPMYYLSRYYKGYRSASVAPHWRIRTGLQQGDTANTTEINLLLALQNYGIKNVDFATVWGQGHTQAERTGNATTNFITWVEQTVAT